MSHYASLIDSGEFGPLADWLNSPGSDIHFLIYVRSQAELIRCAENLDADWDARSTQPGRLTPSVEQGIKEGSFLLSERPAPYLEFQTTEPDTVPRDTPCHFLYYPPFCLLHAPGVFERDAQTQDMTRSPWFAREKGVDAGGTTQQQILWYQPKSFVPNEVFYGDEVPILENPHRIDIVRPKNGEFLEGELVAARVRWANQNFMILNAEEQLIGVLSDVRLRNDVSRRIRVRLRGVLIEPPGQEPRVAWEVYTHSASLACPWSRAIDQYLKLRTEPADRWVKKIQSELLPGFHKALSQEESTLLKWVRGLARINPTPLYALDPALATVYAKSITYGPEFASAYEIVHWQKHPMDSAVCRDAKETLERFERQAESLEGSQLVRLAREEVLSEDRRLRGLFDVHRTNIGILEESLRRTEVLLRTLQEYGTTNVVMGESMVRETRSMSPPVFIRAESFDQAVGQGR